MFDDRSFSSSSFDSRSWFGIGEEDEQDAPEEIVYPVRRPKNRKRREDDVLIHLLGL